VNHGYNSYGNRFQIIVNGKYPLIYKYKKKIILYGLSLIVTSSLVMSILTAQLKADRDFCRSCHISSNQPMHSKKFSNFLTDPPLNLAGRHRVEKMDCIDCHRGIDLKGKLIITYEELKNTGKYFIGRFVEPEGLNHDFQNINCRICHQRYKRGSNFHNLSSHQGSLPVLCIKCHIVHLKKNEKEIFFLNRTKVLQVCAQCHPRVGKNIKETF